jgi:hypothetical protein
MRKVKLSPREEEVELLTKHGAGYKEIARLLGVGIESVRTYLKNIRRKYAEVGENRSARYLMTPQEYQNQLKTLLKILHAKRAFGGSNELPRESQQPDSWGQGEGLRTPESQSEQDCGGVECVAGRPTKGTTNGSGRMRLDGGAETRSGS